MHEYQAIWPVSFWVHHNVSTLKDRTNRNTRTSIKQASRVLQSFEAPKKKGKGSSKQRNPRKFQTDHQNKN
jgi:hypothetical protein